MLKVKSACLSLIDHRHLSIGAKADCVDCALCNVGKHAKRSNLFKWYTKVRLAHFRITDNGLSVCSNLVCEDIQSEICLDNYEVKVSADRPLLLKWTMCERI